MRYIKRAYIMDTEFMRIESEDKIFYKGLSLCFDKSETVLESVHVSRWMDFKSVEYCISEITKNEFDKMMKLAIKNLK